MKLWHSYLKELKLSSKGFYFYVEIIMTVIILVILLFVIPDEIKTTQTQYLDIVAPEDVEAVFIKLLEVSDVDGAGELVELKQGKSKVEATLYESVEKKVYIFKNEEDMVAQTKVDRPEVGAKLTWDEKMNNFKYDYYLQGYESERLKNLYLVIHSKDLESLLIKSSKQRVEKIDDNVEHLNSRQTALPSLITFNGSLMGLFIIAAYIFLDKQEGVIKAYAVTASKVWEYLLSKALTLMTVTTITTLVIVIPVMGTQPSYLALIILLLTSAFFASSLGLLISSFFNSMTQAFGAIYTVMMLFMLPAIAYFIPSWDPLWVKFIPIHYLIQGFKETIMVNGDKTYVMISSLGFFLVGLLLFLLANKKFKNNLTA